MESKNINFYKGVAMLGVIATHVGAGSLPNGLGRIGANGARGVQLFFIISSYLAFVSFGRNVEKRKWNWKSTCTWLIKKYKKVIPLYLLSIFLYLLIQGSGRRYWLGSVEKVSILNILSHIFFLNGFYPYYINSIQGVEWYLADLFIFYMITPILFLLITSLKRAIILLVSSNVFCVLASFVLSGLCPIQDRYIWSTYVNNFAFFCQFPVWTLGIVLFFLDKKEIKKNNSISALLCGAGVVLMAFLTFFEIKAHVISQWLLWGIAFVLIIVSQKFGSYFNAKNRFIEYLGRLSYPLYLFHYLLIDIWEKYIGITEMNIINWGIKYICITAVSIFISMLISVLMRNKLYCLNQKN